MVFEKSVDLSIIIVNYNANNYLRLCLESIFEFTEAISYELILIDNNSKNSIKTIEDNYPEVYYIKNKNNFGFSYANNQGIKKSKGRYILLLNPDTELLNNAFEKMLKFLDVNPFIGIVGPCVYDGDGNTIQLSCRSFPSFKTFLFNRYSLLTKFFPNNKWSNNYLLNNWDHSEQRKVDWVSGCCMMLRKEMLNEIGLLDTNFFMYNEDVDICMRANKKGWQVYYHPDSKIKHHIGGSSQFAKKKMIVQRHKSIWRFYKKHYSKNIIFDMITIFIIIIRAIYKLVFSRT